MAWYYPLELASLYHTYQPVSSSHAGNKTYVLFSVDECPASYGTLYVAFLPMMLSRAGCIGDTGPTSLTLHIIKREPLFVNPIITFTGHFA